MQIPRWHGFDKQSFMLISQDNPEERKLFRNIRSRFQMCEVKFHTFSVSSLRMGTDCKLKLRRTKIKYLPVYPGGHSHEYPAIASWHIPSFLHG